MPKGIATTFKHGHAARKGNSRAYVCWMNIRRRCENPKASQYAWYGGRGIKVCERWQAFENFLADMGEPKDGESIDRIDSNGNYEPSNCRWVGRDVQGLNKRNVRHLTVRGVTKPIVVWQREMGLSRSVIQYRLKMGYTPEQAIQPGKYVPDNSDAPRKLRCTPQSS